ncbi:cytochrome P450 [Aspergillus sclerotioniger CBS 115572]|uniref:Cytochrome P450 n=1 Tax=Aspergillus sclerotioniger CBS 115572 TaxID=1450535 RepID=A0A317V653_9EURO|nr:cytochrome P450 [Aspergillus sclerotioniger CBS 115572]PWY67640.1 cytochrome P450 [Aspergillus sclerotioniger CBS 115572]
MFDTRLVLLGLVAGLVYVWHRRKPDPREPPVVNSRIPIIGHLLGMLWYGLPYFTLATKKHSHPICTLDMVFNKTYIVQSPTVLHSIQRNRKTLSFDPFVSMTLERMAGIHGPTLELFREKESGGQGLSHDVIVAMQPTLTGRPLDRMNECMARNLRPWLDELAGLPTIDLHAWCSRVITAASTAASYGPLNPYQDPRIEKALWDFESHLSLLLANFLPWLTARTSWKGRETVVAAFVKYYELGGHKEGSELTYIRWKTMHDGGVPLEHIARQETAMGLGLLSNSVPATFWAMFDLYSRPDLLAEIRQEMRAHVLRVEADHRHIIDISALRDQCPLLLSTFQEILRVRSAGAPTRFVLQDTVVADQYLLKAGSVVNMPGEVIGQSDEAWGSSAHEFDARRYIKTEKNPRRTGGFMPFGVSPVICPGRHFASAEILALVAMLALRFDMVPVDGSWQEPPINSQAIASSMRPPKHGFDVRVIPRKEYEGVEWDFEVKEGTGMFNLMVG